MPFDLKSVLAERAAAEAAYWRLRHLEALAKEAEAAGRTYFYIERKPWTKLN